VVEAADVFEAVEVEALTDTGAGALVSSVGSKSENATGVVDVALAGAPETSAMNEPFASWA